MIISCSFSLAIDVVFSACFDNAIWQIDFRLPAVVVGKVAHLHLHILSVDLSLCKPNSRCPSTFLPYFKSLPPADTLLTPPQFTPSELEALRGIFFHISSSDR
ncbi:hypothetical protein BD769DRAFT_845768 [Suillus cothurnatus]|nr:hypothetical protein BD769DRAFT_845768 [Suillus cothurnatus]